MPTQDPRPTIHIPGTTSHTIPSRAGRHGHEGSLRYLKAGTGSPLVLLHTVRTQAEHFRHLVPLVSDRYTVYALDLPGMGYSEIVPGASYDEPAMRAGVERLLTELDLHDVTLAGESMGAVLALTTAADLPERVRRVVAVNTYDFRGGIARSSLLARVVVGGVLTPGVGPVIAGWNPGPPSARSCGAASATRAHCGRTTWTNSSRWAAAPATRPSPGPCTRPCPASSPPAPATPRSRPPSTSSTARTTGPGRRTGRPTGGCCRPPTSLRCRRPATSSPWNGPTYWPTC
ncbi:alpha/beta fold hydrolase [Streptomyces sp. B21-106]|uniref:alpha/beta fold hydrolase n=1 Tax=Streptomyces sp. B21-106 TaxID=3039418 RepID=UPI003FA6DA44